MSKEKILEYFSDINYVYNDCTRLDSLRYMLEELVSEAQGDAVHKWIPCKDRLPESYGKYIVTRDDPVFGIYVRMLNYGEADFAKKNPCWFYYDSEYGDVTVDNVIAWMQLPEPYKMDGKVATVKNGDSKTSGDVK